MKIRQIALILMIITSGMSCSLFKMSESKKENIIFNSGFIPNADLMLSASKEELSIYNFIPKEVIADIGFGSGWLEGLIVLQYDSLTLYPPFPQVFRLWRATCGLLKLQHFYFH